MIASGLVCHMGFKQVPYEGQKYAWALGLLIFHLKENSFDVVRAKSIALQCFSYRYFVCLCLLKPGIPLRLIPMYTKMRLSLPTLDYSTSYEKSNNTRSKVKVGFLENLNAKLAEQRLSGKAFAVRNLINSKALVSV